MDSLLRMGFFRTKVPVFADRFVTVQMVCVVALVCATGVALTITHSTGIMMVDDNLVAQSAAIFSYFGGLAGFLFGFYIFDNLGTYMTIKNVYLGGFWGYSTSSCPCLRVWWRERQRAAGWQSQPWLLV